MLDGYQTDAYLKKLTQTSESKSETINAPKMTGWICPVCGRGVSPYTAVCPCKNGSGEIISVQTARITEENR